MWLITSVMNVNEHSRACGTAFKEGLQLRKKNGKALASMHRAAFVILRLLYDFAYHIHIRSNSCILLMTYALFAFRCATFTA